MKNIRLTIAYDGGRFLGWQKTIAGPSVQESLENILKQILQEEIALQAASRTDAGVHAHGQIANFFTSATLDLTKFLHSLNRMLPKDIAVLAAEVAPPRFHPTLDCLSKEYRYHIATEAIHTPDKRYYTWHCPGDLDYEAMQKAAAHLIGRHDFSAFCNRKKNEVYDSHVREVTEISLHPQTSHQFYFKVCGHSFLYKMVRNIVGTLIYVGKGKLKETDMPELLFSGDRKKIGMTAPAHALTLFKLYYPN
ncbi:MAG: tRNA pseudouridine(38-40) synthase TruA [Parachlamydia sp.]|nr:MAG: tRNA pseudouridine(38-40) synthase TruA [Parachlamydia sp.]